jgi:hypothetical protein
MKKQDAIALFGAVILAVGVFLPVWRWDYEDQSTRLLDINEENNISADGPGVHILILVAVSVLLILMGRSDYLWVTGLTAAWSLYQLFISSWTVVQNDPEIHLDIGWLFLAAGVGLMVAPLWFDHLESRFKTPEEAEAESEQVPEPITSDEETES